MPKRHTPVPIRTEAERLQFWMNRKTTTETFQVPPGQKFAVVYLPLHPDVDQGEDGEITADYLALRNAIEGVTGIQAGVKLVIDGQVPPALVGDGDATIGVSVTVRDNTKAAE